MSHSTVLTVVNTNGTDSLGVLTVTHNIPWCRSTALERTSIKIAGAPVDKLVPHDGFRMGYQCPENEW